jgi:hypothetical protein
MIKKIITRLFPLNVRRNANEMCSEIRTHLVIVKIWIRFIHLKYLFQSIFIFYCTNFNINVTSRHINFKIDVMC